MAKALDNQHLHYFSQNDQIEFEDFFRPELYTSFNNSLRPIEDKNPPFNSKLLNGFDLWRRFNSLKNLTCHLSTAQVLGELLNLKELIYGFSFILSDQFYDNDYALLAKKCVIQNLVGGVCICLKEATKKENPYFPTKENSAVFFKIDEEFFLRFFKTDGEYLFIFFTDKWGAFSHQADDLLSRHFRKLGYESVARLKRSLNPFYSLMIV